MDDVGFVVGVLLMIIGGVAMIGPDWVCKDD